MPEYVGTPLTRETTAALLERLGVPADRYHLSGAHINDALVLDQRPEGWVVFYTERGLESQHRAHETEAAACADLVERLLEDMK